MDVRIINTQKRILGGFIGVLAYKKLSECRTIDIIKEAEVSKRTFYNYFKNKDDFVHRMEGDILSNLKKSLIKDREIIKQAHDASARDIILLANSAFNETLKYCDEHKEELAALLSSNGDINFYHAVVNLANDEFVARVPYLFGITSVKVKDEPLYKFFQELYVNEIINLLIFWLNNRDTMSVDNVKYLAGLVQTRSSMQLMKALS